MPEVAPRTRPDTLIDLHLSFGAFILLLAIVGAAWRIAHPVALAPDPEAPWRRIAASASHLALYLLLVAVPLIGWADASARGFPVELLGLIRLPALVSGDARLAGSLGDIHAAAAYGLLGLIGVYALIALYRRFLPRDDTLLRMLPSGAPEVE